MFHNDDQPITLALIVLFTMLNARTPHFYINASEKHWWSNLTKQLYLDSATSVPIQISSAYHPPTSSATTNSLATVTTTVGMFMSKT